jgi:UV DNA damage endonuclease
MYNHLGYACINMTLGKKQILTGRAMRKATLEAKGLSFASSLALQNARDLLTILKWNLEHDIYFFRLGSDLFPWGNKVDVYQFPDIEEIKSVLLEAGNFATKHNMRITTHPGPFNLLASPKEDVVQNTIRDLEMHALVFDFMGLSRTPYNKINIHVGATYGDKETAAATWCKNFLRLSEGVRSRLTVENDDKANMYSVLDLYYLIHSKVGVPIVFDFHHHTFCTGDLSAHDALELAVSTWPKGIRPATHYSESKALHESNDKLNPRAHSDYITGVIDTFEFDVDVMIEAKAKELALLQYRVAQEKFSKNPAVLCEQR